MSEYIASMKKYDPKPARDAIEKLAGCLRTAMKREMHQRLP